MDPNNSQKLLSMDADRERLVGDLAGSQEDTPKPAARVASPGIEISRRIGWIRRN